MARRSSALDVRLNGRQVGQLARAANGAISFRYERQWLDWEYALPVSLSLPLDTLRYTGAQVSAVFDNLLPDNDAIRRRIAERVGADGADAYIALAISCSSRSVGSRPPATFLFNMANTPPVDAVSAAPRLRA